MLECGGCVPEKKQRFHSLWSESALAALVTLKFFFDSTCLPSCTIGTRRERDIPKLSIAAGLAVVNFVVVSLEIANSELSSAVLKMKSTKKWWDE